MTHKAVFLDRDDTLIDDPGYIKHPSQVKLLPGVGQSLTLLKKMGYLLVVVTNQSGVARGIITQAELETVHHHLKKLLADEDVFLDGLYHCPYHPEGTVQKYAKESDLRKPRPGMLLEAAKELDIDLSQSWMIGDSYRDIAAGHRAGCQTILLDTPGKAKTREPNDPEPDKRAVNLREAVNILRMVEFQQKAIAARAAQGKPDPAEPTPPPVEPTESTEPKEDIAPPAAAPAKPATQARPAAAAAPAIPKEAPNAVESAPAAKPAPTPPPTAAAPVPDDTPPQALQQTLDEILHRVKSKSRYDQYAEFSVFMLLAWLVQSLAAFSLVASIWFWLDTAHGVESVQTMIGYAVALQLLVIALLMMHDKNQ